MKEIKHVVVHHHVMHAPGAGQQGEGFFGDMFDKIIKPVYEKAVRPAYENVIKPVGKYAIDNKLISKGLKVIPHPYARAAGEVADALGAGKKKRARKAAAPRGKKGLRTVDGVLTAGTPHRSGKVGRVAAARAAAYAQPVAPLPSR